MMNIVMRDETEVGACIMGLTSGFFLPIYYEKYFCSKKYLQRVASTERYSWGAWYGIMQTPLAVVPLPPQQKDVSHVAPPSHH
jgi:hypothetical protein